MGRMDPSWREADAVGPPPAPDPETVLVAVPTLNEADHVDDCLASLFSDPWMRDVALVVADGGSTDATVSIVTRLGRRWPTLRLIDNPGRLQSAAINAVARLATPRTRFLVRCDAHATYPPGYVRAVVAALAARPDAVALATPMDATGATCFQRAAAWVVDTRLGSGGSAHRGGQRSMWVDHGHHAGFRIDAFRGVGGYDESFSHNEDAELDHRLGLSGGKIWLDAGIRVGYRMRPTPRALLRQYWNYGRGRARTLRKHRLRPRFRQVLPAANLAALALCVALAPVAPAFLALPALYLALLVAVSVTAMLRLGSACGIWAGLALALIHNGWGAGVFWQLLRGGRR
ncbi:glycosyltransferase family 2 protein [Limimaricola hongkongensis]|uniref:Putative glycosyl transferase ExoA n=1 Tax=Limimaricola hongkongensis DSM 17492 TaxID=1122180 RepID=A0A017H739_9RHOB|nr:glycosyltransferase family 2 protein [Limimaricola hongkongensis]EYD70362.1 putative glycosyl transferase ExoA [Limimaricola hongkongensis DSM 17492]